MNNLTRTTLLLLIALCSSARAQSAHWKTVTPQGITQEDIVTGLDFLSADAGYIGTWSLSGDGQVYATTDGGTTWQATAVPGTSITGLKFFDPMHGLLIGTRNQQGVILSTSNGAQSWETVTQTPGSPSTIFFVDATTGFVCGSGGMVMKTEDGGAHWTSITVPVAAQMSIQSVCFPSTTTGYMTAFTAQGWPTKLLKSTDGGATWSLLQDYGDGSGNGKVFISLAFMNDQVGFACGREGTPAIFKTTDGGVTWTKVFAAQGQAGNATVDAVRFADASVGYAVGDNGMALRTGNGGQSWVMEFSTEDNTLATLDVIDEDVVYAGGIFGAVVKRETSAAQPSILLSTQILGFGNVDVGATKDLTFTISAANAAGLRIDSLYFDDFGSPGTGFTLVNPPASLPLTVQQGSPLTVTARFAPVPGGDSDAFGQIVIVTNSADGSHAYVSLTGHARQQQQVLPSAVASVTSLDFGAVETSASKELSLTISAGSTAPLRIDGISVLEKSGASGSFSVTAPTDPTPLTVTQGSPLAIRVRFRPEAEGPFVSDLVVTTNDPSNAKLTIPMAGQGVAATSAVAPGSRDASDLAIDVSPNPVAAVGIIRAHGAPGSRLSIRLEDATGKVQSSLFDGNIVGGDEVLPFDTRDLSSGVYYCVLESNGKRTVRSIVISH